MISTDLAITDSTRGLGSQTSALTDSALIGAAGILSHTRQLPEWINRVEGRLSSLMRLGPDWDSYGAAAISHEIVRSAYGFILFLAAESRIPEPEISPTRNGGVLLEWHNGDHELEVQLVSKQAASYVYENANTNTTVTGYLFCDDANDGCFLKIVHDYFERRN